jgi:integrase/recombinase XerD
MTNLTTANWNDDPFAAFNEYIEIHGYADKTRKTKLSMFSSFLNYIEQIGVNLKSVTQTIITEYLKEKASNEETKETYLHLLSDIFNHMIENNEIDNNPAERIYALKKKNKRGRKAKRIPVFLSETESAVFIAHIRTLPKHYSGMRMRCAMLLMLGCGLRVKELCDLKDNNMHLLDQNPYLTIIGKNNKERSVPIPDAIINELLDFRDMRNSATSIFLNAMGTGEAYTPIGVYTMVRRELKAAGIIKTKMSPHVLRHTFCTTQLANGNALAVVKAWMGHDYISTTAGYEHVQGARNGEKPTL